MYEDTKIKIMDILNNENKAIEVITIAEKTNTGIRETTDALEQLERELKVKMTKKGRYICTDYKFGKISIIKSGAGFVRLLDEDDIYVKKQSLKNIIDGDNVVVEIIDYEKKEGRILKVLSHDRECEVGQVITLNDNQYVQLDDAKKRKILIALSKRNVSLVDGHKVTVRIGNLIKNNIYDGKVIKVLGHINDPGIDIISKAVKFNIETEFSSKVMEEVEKIPVELSQTDYINRRDLREKSIITIDGDTAKDLDDAISIEILPNHNFLLGVHIADVDHYVKQGSELDKTAYERGTSCYLANRVVPMLPHKLSNGMCSLNGGVDRLTQTCMMEINPNGKLINYEIFDSVINSKKRMTYKKVQDCLDNKNLDPSYTPFENDLKMMKQLSNTLRNRREKNGSIDFDSIELKIVVDESGKAIDVLKDERIESEKIIEDFMIEANVTVATHISFMDLPFVYRVHGEPNIEKLEEFVRFTKLMNEKIDKLPKKIHPKVIKKILETLKESPDFEIYSKLLLRCMQKAIYDVNNIGHFGLSLENYTHFTSPIRRYPDLLVHRLLKQYRNQQFYSGDKNVDNQLQYLIAATKHSSIKEQNAVKCEREVNKMKSAEYMENHIGETFTGKINSVTAVGLYVDIYNGVEGFIRIVDLNGGFYDKDTYSIFTADNNQYRIGDYVEVIVNSSIKDLGEINLELINKLEKSKVFKK